MIRETSIALRLTIVTFVLTGLVYPLVSTILAQALFSDQATGSLIKDEQGKVIGSSLIGQPFASPAYFQPRPSAAGSGYDGQASGGSNLGSTSQKLRDRLTADVERLKKDNPDAPLPIPVDLVTASASGLDPHISLAAALWQVPRIAKARPDTSADRIRRVIDSQAEGRDLGFLGEPRVNVLLLNLALDRQFGKPH
jgi:K+-transporting ATPase ATPase C chain